MATVQSSEYSSVNIAAALNSTACDKVEWTETIPDFQRVAELPGKATRFGFVDRDQPLVIVHEIEKGAVDVVTPARASDWPWWSVDRCPQLMAFLRKHVEMDDPDTGLNRQTPRTAFSQREMGDA